MPARCWNGVDGTTHASASSDGRHEGVARWYADLATAVRGVLSVSIIKHVGCVRLHTTPCVLAAPAFGTQLLMSAGPESANLRSAAQQHDHQYIAGRHRSELAWHLIERTMMNGITREPKAAPARKTPQKPRVFQRSVASKAIPLPIRTHGWNNATAATDTTALHF